MTNKESIFKLIEYKRWLERNFERFNTEPFDMAIGALEEKETREQYEKWEAIEEEEAREYFERKRQLCEDCISRQAAIDVANKVIERDTSGNNDVVNAMIAWSAFIKSLPSVTPQPKVGEWLKNGELCKCSNCHSLVLRSVVKAYNYCFRCGAKMEVEE